MYIPMYSEFQAFGIIGSILLLQELQPVVYCVTLPLPGHMAVDSQSPDMLDISATYSVSINIKIVQSPFTLRV